MTRKLIIITFALLLPLAACSREETEPASSTAAAVEEKTYDLEGTIISRDAATNQLTVDHKEIPGYMAAMTMPYEVRGQNVADLPPDGTRVTAKVHATEAAYWLTDVQPMAGGAATDTSATDTTATDTSVTTGTTDTAGTTTGL